MSIFKKPFLSNIGKLKKSPQFAEILQTWTPAASNLQYIFLFIQFESVNLSAPFIFTSPL